MMIHEIRGRNLREALERARERHGEKAVVVSHRKSRAGVKLAVADEVPRTPEDLNLLRRSAQNLLADSAAAPRGSTEDVERALTRAGATRNLIERTCEAVAGRLTEGLHPLDLAAQELAAIFPIAHAKRRHGAATILALVGQTGVGKTATAAKIVTQMSRAGRRVALATLDANRVGAVEQARAIGRRLSVPTMATRDATKLVDVLHQRPELELIVLDTTGRGAEDMDQIQRLEEALLRRRVPARIEPYLVVPAGVSSDTMAHARKAVGDSIQGCVLTKFDETPLPAPSLEFASRERLPIAFLTDGPEADGNLYRAKGETFANLLLKGRLA
tara:strand:- start:5409 stop:6398 length:990 start_codon:yes stop_codon:yes gene_type:complete